MALILRASKSNANCIDCGFCKFFTCAWNRNCTGCGACVISCPNNARKLVNVYSNRDFVKITIDGIKYEVPGQITILKALEISGYKISTHLKHKQDAIHAPCGTGGCGECSVLVNNELKPSCVTPVHEGMDIVTDPSTILKYPPRRIVTVFNKSVNPRAELYGIRDSSFFMHGCNMNCPSCHNWNITFSMSGSYFSPDQLIRQVSAGDSGRGINRIGISGGEATLNRRWLADFIRQLSVTVPHNVRIQLDTNAALLDKDYVDELIDAGITDISPDIKGVSADSFQKLTGLADQSTARLYMDNAWQTLKYILDQCEEKLFTVVGIPFHKELMTYEELYKIGRKLASINHTAPVNLIEYQAAFRQRDLSAVSPEETEKSLRVLRDAGLINVLCQAAAEMPLAVDPMDLIMGEERNW